MPGLDNIVVSCIMPSYLDNRTSYPIVDVGLVVLRGDFTATIVSFAGHFSTRDFNKEKTYNC